MQKLKTLFSRNLSPGYVCVLVTFLLTIGKNLKEATQGRNDLCLHTTSRDIVHHDRASMATQVVQFLVVAEACRLFYSYVGRSGSRVLESEPEVDISFQSSCLL